MHIGVYAQVRGHSGFIFLRLYKLHRCGTNNTAFQICLLFSLIKLGWDYIYGTHSDLSLSSLSLSYAHPEEHILVKRRKQCKIVYALMKTVNRLFKSAGTRRLGLLNTCIKIHVLTDLTKMATMWRLATIFNSHNLWIWKILNSPFQVSFSSSNRDDIYGEREPLKSTSGWQEICTFQRCGFQLQQNNYTEQRMFCKLYKRLKSNS